MEQRSVSPWASSEHDPASPQTVLLEVTCVVRSDQDLPENGLHSALRYIARSDTQARMRSGPAPLYWRHH